jgi:hypothetical protein
MLTLPTYDELHKEYRRTRMEILWGGCREYIPDVYTFTGDFNKDHFDGKKKLKKVCLKVDPTVKFIQLATETTVVTPTIELLDGGIFYAMAKLGHHLVISYELLASEYFMRLFVENRYRFCTIRVWVPDNVILQRVDSNKLYKRCQEGV